MSWIQTSSHSNVSSPPQIRSQTSLRHNAKHEALNEWEEIWPKDPRRNLAYDTFTTRHWASRRNSKAGIENFSRPVFCTAIRMLTENMASQGNTTLGITQCPRYNGAREQYFCPVSITLSTPHPVSGPCIVFKKGNLVHFLPTDN